MTFVSTKLASTVIQIVMRDVRQHLQSGVMNRKQASMYILLVALQLEWGHHNVSAASLALLVDVQEHSS